MLGQMDEQTDRLTKKPTSIHVYPIMDIKILNLCLTPIAITTVLHCSPKIFNPSKLQILDFTKLKEFADDNLDENGRKFSKQVEKTVGKGEIARYEQFLLFPQCFQKTYTADM